MAMPIYITINGKVQGDFKGGCTREGHEGQIDVLALKHEIAMPFDESKGHHRGRRVHHPLEIIKEVDSSSPLLYNAMVTHELLDVKIVWYRQEASTGGVEEHYFTTTLEEATVIGMNAQMPNQVISENTMVPHMEEVRLAYKGIIWTYEPDSIETQDHHDKAM